MPPRKKREKPDLPDFPEPTSDFKYNQGFRYGLSDNPPMLGQVSIPEGKGQIFEGITFVATGTMPSITREDLRDIIEKYGGRLTSSISGVTDVVIRGCIEVGPKKLEDAKKRKLTIIDEEGLFKVIADSNPDYVPPPPPRIEGGTELSTTSFPISTLFTEKYRPRFLSDVIGNIGAINHLIEFLESYGSDKKCAIVSGQPGIGKSTCVSLIAQYCKYHPIEFNASDSRSKKILNENFTDIFSNKSLYTQGDENRICIIFDEIDGMSSGDRGGLQQLVKFIDASKNPVICICNNRNNKKLETLAKHSVDIQFVPIPAKSVAQRLKEIAEKENIPITDEQLLHVAKTADGDMRSALNSLQFWVPNLQTGESLTGIADKDIIIDDTLDATMKLFKSTTTIDEKFECFFTDYGLMPIAAYVNVPFNDKHSWADALESFADGDVLDSQIRGDTSWNLLNAEGFFMNVYPATVAPRKSGSICKNAFVFFGQMSKQKKLQRYFREIGGRASRTIFVPYSQLYTSVIPLLKDITLYYLTGKKTDVEGFLDFLDEVELTLDDYQHILELLEFREDMKDKPKSPIATKIKTAVTKGYKQRHNDVQTTIGKESDVRSDYYIVDKPTAKEMASVHAEDKPKKRGRKKK